MASSNTKRIVLLGKSGTGKSSLANTVFGEKAFTVGHTLNSETKRCKSKTVSVNGRVMTVIDSPGFFDTDRSEEEMKPEIVRCITDCAPGPHAFVLMLKVEKYTEHEKAVISKMHEYFSEEVFKYAVVIFTHGDQLQEGQTIKDFVSQNKSLHDLVKKCGGRCHVIDNKYWNKNREDKYRSNRFQVEELLKTIDKIVEENQGGCYTNEMLEAMEEEIQKEKKHIRHSAGHMSKEEIRKQAEDNVYKKILIRVAGVATGVLIGGICGVSAMVAAVCTVLKLASELDQFGLALKITTGITLGTAAAGGGAAAAGGGAAAAAGAAAAGAAAGGGAAAAAGAAAAGAAAAGAGAALIKVSIVVAVTGAVIGCYVGYKAAEGAKTPGEGAKKTTEDMMHMVQYLTETAANYIGTIKKTTY